MKRMNLGGADGESDSPLEEMLPLKVGIAYEELVQTLQVMYNEILYHSPWREGENKGAKILTCHLAESTDGRRVQDVVPLTDQFRVDTSL